MNKNEKFLLLTDVPPCKNYTGGLMTSKLAKFLIEEKVQLCCFCVMDKGLNPNMETSVMNDIGCKFYEKPQENFEIPGFGKNKYNLQLKKLQKKLVDYIKKEKITKVWCTLQGEVMVSLLNTVRKNGIDYVAQIWDPIEWWIKENNFSEKRKLLPRIVQRNDDGFFNRFLRRVISTANLSCEEVTALLYYNRTFCLRRNRKTVFRIPYAFNPHDHIAF